MTYKDLEKHNLALAEIQEKKRVAFSDWLKNIITIASAILGILISLKTEKTKSVEEHYIFIFTITSIGLGILSGLIVLFSEVTLFSLFESKKKEQILQLLDGKDHLIDYVGIPRIYTFLKYFCFFSFFCSLISLIIFAILSDI
jgi:hypothetical protein